MSGDMAIRRAELLDDLAAQAAQLLTDVLPGTPKDKAEQLGGMIADHFAEHWGGQVISYPKDYAYKLAGRDREMLEAHRRGATVAELADRSGMSERGVRKLLARARLRDVNLYQARLFD